MPKKLYFILLVLLTSTTALLAQKEEVNEKQQEKVKSKADTQYEEYSFRPAIDIYKKVLDKGYVSADLLKRLGNSYYFNAKYDEASEIYKKLVESYPDDTEADYFFRYAQTLRTLGEYEAASEIMAKFKEMTAVSEDYAFDEDYLEKIEENSGRYEVKSFE